MSNNNSKAEIKLEPTENVFVPKNISSVKLTHLEAGQVAKAGDIVPINFGEIQDRTLANLLQWYLNSANPVYQEFKETVQTKGGEQTRIVQKRTHYSYGKVDGMKFEEWIQAKINKDYKLDAINNQVVRTVTAPEAKDALKEAEAIKAEETQQQKLSAGLPVETLKKEEIKESKK